MSITMLQRMLCPEVVSDVAGHIARSGDSGRETGGWPPRGAAESPRSNGHMGEAAIVAPRPFSAVFPGRGVLSSGCAVRRPTRHVAAAVAARVAAAVAAELGPEGDSTLSHGGKP